MRAFCGCRTTLIQAQPISDLKRCACAKLKSDTRREHPCPGHCLSPAKQEKSSLGTREVSLRATEVSAFPDAVQESEWHTCEKREMLRSFTSKDWKDNHPILGGGVFFFIDDDLLMTTGGCVSCGQSAAHWSNVKFYPW
ncbi:hypothetical protein CAPTEDRAFT_190620 [Capitella teleta]|uniref:Uncharacterized protein n=1 Tax=Capitella teleta TaxID=283909 RepID=R7UBZ1_CAPTE|nr:hypothetical protein CAPTEDRAFT_190620 [Capitella teleta]|eukprot:ELU00787.1 hypothetical protein CAPTEDRAFT_190620 [Capitella teleta]